MEPTPEQKIRFLKELNDMKKNKIREYENIVEQLNIRCNELTQHVWQLQGTNLEKTNRKLEQRFRFLERRNETLSDKNWQLRRQIKILRDQLRSAKRSANPKNFKKSYLRSLLNQGRSKKDD